MKKIITLGLIAILLLTVTACLKQDTNPNYMGYKMDVFWKGTNKHAHNILNRSLSYESHLAWATGNHTASPVPVGAVGPEKYISKLKGIVQNTDIADVCHEAVLDGINVILVIGDGMGVNHMSLPIYMNVAENKQEKTYFEKIMKEGACGLSLTNPINGVVTGSAAAGTALASGTKTYVQALGIDTCGNKLESTLELAEKHGCATGLITDTGITDATPAAFYAHSVDRDWENNIAAQLIENNEIEVVFGGGAKRFIPKDAQLADYYNYKNCSGCETVKSVRDDDKDLFKQFDDKGYNIICTGDELAKLDKNTDKVVGLFSPGGLDAAIDRFNEETSQPSLVECASKGIEILEPKDKNFFLMIEAGRIDWEAHDNDAGAVYQAVSEMNDILGVCYNHYEAEPKKNLVIFTADHETGGFNISYTKLPKGEKYSRKLKSGETWTNVTDPLHFDKFQLLKEQKSTIYRMFEKGSSAEYLKKHINENVGYKITDEDAKVLHEVRNSYKKGK